MQMHLTIFSSPSSTPIAALSAQPGTDEWFEQMREAGHLMVYPGDPYEDGTIIHLCVIEPDPELTRVVHTICGPCCDAHELGEVAEFLGEKLTADEVELVTCQACFEGLGWTVPEQPAK